MRIGIDARPLISKNLTGIGVYLANILEYFSKNDTTDEFVLYSHKEPEGLPEVSDRFSTHIISGPWKIGTLQFMAGLSGALQKDKTDVFWGTTHMLPGKVPEIRYVLSVHDMALIRNPKWGRAVNSLIQHTVVMKSIQNADALLTISQSTKDDIVSICGRSEKDISVVYPGASGQHPQHRLKQPFFLYVGTLEPRKNVDTIVRAFERFAETDSDTQLIIAGGLGWKYRPILDKINRSPVRNRIRLTGYVSAQEKADYYGSAAALLFPSHYEGFGLPIVEAMSAGTPVITAKNSSLPEVGGQAAFYVDDENDFERISGLMSMVRSMPAEDMEKLRLECMEQSRRFDWERCGAETLRLLRNEHG